MVFTYRIIIYFCPINIDFTVSILYAINIV